MDKQISLYDMWIALLNLGWRKGYITSSQVPFPEHMDVLQDAVMEAFHMADRYCEAHRDDAGVLMNLDDKRMLALTDSAYLGFLEAWDSVMSGWMEILTGEPVPREKPGEDLNKDPRREVEILLELSEEEGKAFQRHLKDAAGLVIHQIHEINLLPSDLFKAGEAMYLYGIAIGNDTFTGSEE